MWGRVGCVRVFWGQPRSCSSPLPAPAACTHNKTSFSKLSDKELLDRLLVVAQAEGVAHTPDGLEAVGAVRAQRLPAPCGCTCSHPPGVPACPTPPTTEIKCIRPRVQVVFTADGDMRQALNNLQARGGPRRRGVWVCVVVVGWGGVGAGSGGRSGGRGRGPERGRLWPTQVTPRRVGNPRP